MGEIKSGITIFYVHKLKSEPFLIDAHSTKWKKEHKSLNCHFDCIRVVFAVKALGAKKTS